MLWKGAGVVLSASRKALRPMTRHASVREPGCGSATVPSLEWGGVFGEANPCLICSPPLNSGCKK